MDWEPVRADDSDDPDRDDILRFFDGRPPTWCDVSSDRIVRRSVVDELIADVKGTSRTARVGKLRLLLGPSGEGKTTALMQTAVEVAREPDWNVYWREPEGRLDAQSISRLPRNAGPYLLVTDDGEEIAHDLYRIASTIRRADIHFLVGARTVDWHGAKGDTYPWGNLLGYRHLELKGLSRDDADAIVGSWAAYGSAGLGALDQLDDRAAQVEQLCEAANEESVKDGAFLGAMLRVRYADGFDNHILLLMRRLHGRRVGERKSLLTAFSFIAATHALGITDLSPAILAELMGVGRGEVSSLVVHPLADESVVTKAGGAILTRHRMIAEAAMRIAQRFNIPRDELYAELVRAVMEVGRHGFVRGYENFTHLGRTLYDAGDESGAIAAARAAVDADPNVLSYVHNLAIVLRKSGAPDEAAALCESVAFGAADMADGKKAGKLRVFYFEWSSAEGSLGRRHVNVWLAAVSLSDLREDDTPTAHHVESALGSIGGSLLTWCLSNPQPDRTLLMGIRSAEVLGHTLDLSSTAAAFFARQRREAGDLGAGPLTPQEAVSGLTAAIRRSWELRERNIPALPAPAALRFTQLFSFLGLEDQRPVADATG
ncbi:hypothetical protein COUCH_06555 [Couchioplanes caeruleus]|uniref:P-loop NTPase n=1 Tax=Couchioplanes caeruleus TaxID=56438 RepID=UPI0020BE9DD7|nr:hypothetical protein [Couchioplanes caeruleus]UQU65960.1 hypothetical protein COUCH_06555 [Couchioplanes caeruleus]